MDRRQPALLVGLHQREGRARHFDGALIMKGRDQPAGERRLAAAEIAGEQDDVARPGDQRQLVAERQRRRFVRQVSFGLNLVTHRGWRLFRCGGITLPMGKCARFRVGAYSFHRDVHVLAGHVLGRESGCLPDAGFGGLGGPNRFSAGARSPDREAADDGGALVDS